jgi:cobalt/nickel transport protein
MRSRTFLLAGLAVVLLVAGVGSYYASAHPDGLEHVAREAGFLDRAEESPAADGPFAGYSTTGVDDARLGGGLAGVAGSVVVLALAFGLFRVLRRRTPSDGPAGDRT